MISVLKTNEEMNQRHKILQSFVWWVGADSLIKKLGKFTDFKTLFSAVLTDFVKPIFIKS